MIQKTFAVLTAMCALAAGPAQASIRITEWMYQGAPAPAVPPEAGEFVELTNVGAVAIDMTGWTFDDDSADPSLGMDLSALGAVQPGESVVWTDWGAELFRAAWGLPAATKIIGNSSPGLGRADAINIYDAADNLVESLTYDDDAYGHVRTRQVSANIAFSALGSPTAAGAITSVVGDVYGSYANTRGDVGNPGSYAPVAVPEPATLTLGSVALITLAAARRRTRAGRPTGV